MDIISFIVHKRTALILMLFIVPALFVKVPFVSATEVLNIKIDPPSPAYNQPFKCTLTLDQDDHRNACDLLPLDAGPDDRPWDICRIDHISNDALTRYYNCIANTSRHVPGPGAYQIVVWNFTGDGETGQIIARQNITILASLPPSPTKTPKPTPTAYVPPTDVPAAVSQPTQVPQQIPTSAPPTYFSIHPTLSIQYELPTTKPSPVLEGQPSDISLKFIDDLGSSLSSYLASSVLRTQISVLAPIWNIIGRFLEETHF